MQHLLLPIAALALLLATGLASGTAAPPNIIVVLVDDMGWGDLSSFGNREVRTGHIDRLAAEGIRFESFYVNSPICSPSRTAILTGQYPQGWRIGSYLSNRKDNGARGIAQWLAPDAPSLPRMLKAAGYATGHFGKWHMGGQRDVGDAPPISAYGFDASLTNFEGLGPRVLPLLDAYDGKPARKYSLGSDALGGDIRWDDRSTVTATFVSAALDFMKRADAAGTPFFVNVWPDDPHSPFFPPRDRRGDGSKKALYHGVLETMDEQLGVLFDHVRSNERLRRNTLILFLSDNGPEQGAGSAGPFRGLKAMLYEGGIRSPLIVWGPGLIATGAAGTVNRQSVVAAMDFAPSLLSLAGGKPPSGVTFDGVPMLDVLLGKSARSRERPIFYRRPPDRDSIFGVQGLPDLAVRDGQWKLLCEYDGSGPQLYDLDADPGETTNLAAREPAVVERLTAALVAWHQTMPPDAGATYAPPRSLP